MENTEKSEISRLAEIVENLSSRIAAIEALLPVETGQPPAPVKKINKESSEDFEFRMGEQWFGKIGIIAFLFAAFYLLTLPFGNGSRIFILLSGFLISAALMIVSFIREKQLKSLAGYLAGSGLIILYFTVLKLHFFSADPLIHGKEIVIPLLFVVCIAGILISLKKNSPALIVVALMLTGTTGLLSDSLSVIIPVLLIIPLASVYIEKKYKWETPALFLIPLTYIFYFLWFINNPVAGGEIGIRTDSPFSVLIIPVIMGIYGFALIPAKEPDEYNPVLKVLMNSVFGYILFIYVTLNNKVEYPALLNFAVSMLLLSVAARYWILQKSKICTFIYSMAGYGALSLAIVLNFAAPQSFILLCWQSLLVVSTALWFRSRFIVVANFLIFFMLLAVYIISWGRYDILSLSFGLVALISARLINIHRLRLELQSEQLRNAYLVLAVLFIPYVLYSILPSSLVGISWILLAFLYYVIGKLINNKKYRIMASATLIMSLAYIFIYALTSGDALFKILSFLLVSIALVVISVVYAKVRTREMG